MAVPKQVLAVILVKCWANLTSNLQSDDYNGALVQSLHDAARVFELAIRAQISGSKLSWFSAVGVDQNAWVKALSYQVR